MLHRKLRSRTIYPTDLCTPHCFAVHVYTIQFGHVVNRYTTGKCIEPENIPSTDSKTHVEEITSLSTTAESKTLQNSR